MKSIGLLVLAASTAAWVVPNQQVFIDLQAETSRQRESYSSYLEEVQNELGSAMQSVAEEFEDVVDQASKADPKAMFSKVMEDIHDMAAGGHGEKPSGTAYEIIAKSGYADKFIELLDDFEDVRDLLNSSDADITVFVPTDKAFERIPDHGDKDKKPPKWFIEALLKSHVVQGSWSSRDIFGVHTLPTILDGNHLSEDGSKTPQRLSVKVGFRGIYLNNYNRIVHRDFKATNGIVHGVHGFNLPAPPAKMIVSFLPTVFSTFELAVIKSGLKPEAHRGTTAFVPANGAWAKLGWKANAFLFSHWGRKYLKGLLQYHIVVNQTLYSDAFYGPPKDDAETNIPKGRWHIDLPTTLPGKHLGVDVGRYGRWIDMHVNHYSKVVYQDAIAHDGVVHVVDHVLLPPHDKHGEAKPGEISVEELKDRLAPFVEHDEHDCGHDDKAHFMFPPDWQNMEL